MFFLAILLILLIPTPCLSQTGDDSSDQIWEVGDRRWTIEEERKFEKWVEETITEDFFLDHKIPTDCADAVYAIRWIYARIARLPAAATTIDGRLIGHWSTDWKHLPTHPEWHQDRRFRAALFYLFPRTWTGTLPFDTYPIRISPDSVTPGTIFLETESHTGIINRVHLDGSHPHPLQTWESSLPVKVQKLSMRYLFAAKPDFKAGSGLVKFRWPVFENGNWRYLPAKEHPFYSEEQYHPAFNQEHIDFVEAVASRIDPKHYHPEEKFSRVLETFHHFLKERVSLVLKGFQQCQNGGCQIGSEEWERYTTYGRDGMILSFIDHLSHIIGSNHLDLAKVKKRIETISIPISENRSISLDEINRNHPWFSHHPGDSIEARWGLEKCRMIHEQVITTQKSITFIEKTYRKKDPKYADFSIRQQQHLLAKLQNEWSQSECRDSLPTLSKKEVLPPRSILSTKPRLESKRCEKIRREIQATYDSIDFIEKTYGKEDPEYAFFSTQQQQLILTRLIEEWNQVECKGPIPSPRQK